MQRSGEDKNLFIISNEKLNKLEEDKKIRNRTLTADERYQQIDKTLASLEELKFAKMEQLDEACNLAIISGFDYSVNNVSYHFSGSLSAQANFIGEQVRFDKAKITETEWTVINNSTGNVERIILNQVTFESISDVLATHIDNNIKKLRNTLQGEVENATTIEQVDSIVWQ